MRPLSDFQVQVAFSDDEKKTADVVFSSATTLPEANLVEILSSDFQVEVSWLSSGFQVTFKRLANDYQVHRRQEKNNGCFFLLDGKRVGACFRQRHFDDIATI